MPGWLFDVLHLRTLVLYGTNPFGNRAADGQGQAEADAGGMVWHGWRSGGLTVWKTGEYLWVEGQQKRGRAGRLFWVVKPELTMILISTEIGRKRSLCVPCISKLSVRTGSTGQPQLSHLTAKHHQSANDTVWSFKRNYPVAEQPAAVFLLFFAWHLMTFALRKDCQRFVTCGRETAESLLMMRSNRLDTAGGWLGSASACECKRSNIEKVMCFSRVALNC